MKIKAGFIQTEPVFGEKDKNLARAVELLRGMEAHLVVLPELFNTGYYFTCKDELERLGESLSSGHTVEILKKISIEKNMVIIAGIAEKYGGDFFNSSVLITPLGHINIYRKAHLFYKEKSVFSKGNIPFAPCDTSLGKIGMIICFDWIFPEACRSLALQGAVMICQPANLVLPYCPLAMRVRSMENRVFTITANRVGRECRGGEDLTFIGMSQIVNTKGEILAQAGTDEEEVMVAEIDLDEAMNKHITSHNDIFQDRRPEMYSIITDHRFNNENHNIC